MKKLFILSFAIGLLFTSCDTNMPKVYGTTDTPINDSLEAKIGIQSIVHFEYNGHKYIDFREWSGEVQGVPTCEFTVLYMTPIVIVVNKQ